MKLYKVSQNINNGYDTYDSIIVCAENEEDARLIHPYERVTHYKNGEWYCTRCIPPYDEYIHTNYEWINELYKLKVEYIGEAAETMKKGVVLASFNAG